MADRLTYSRRVLERVSDRKKRKLAIDDSDGVPLESDSDSCIASGSQVRVVEDSQLSPKGHRDLFGELIPPSVISRVDEPKAEPSAPSKKTPASRKKRRDSIDELLNMDTPVRRPTRVFIPTPRIIKIMKDAQADLYHLMGLNKSSTSDTSVISNESLNVSGVQSLMGSPIRGSPIQLETNSPSINNSIHESRSVLEGKYLLII